MSVRSVFVREDQTEARKPAKDHLPELQAVNQALEERLALSLIHI